MQVFFMILWNVIFPVFVLLGSGVLLHRIFKFELGTLSKITTYFLIPAITFTNLYESQIEGAVVLNVLGFLTLQNLGLMIIAAVVVKVFRFDRSLGATFKNSMVLNNSGNFGLPVSQLVFAGNPLGLSIQIVATIFQTLVTYTYGLLNCVSLKHGASRTLLEFFKLPILYALIAGILLNALAVEIPASLWNPVKMVSDAFPAIALLTLGAQCAYLDLKRFSLPLVLSLLGRLIVSPLLGLALIFALQLEGTIAQALFIASSYPSNRNSALFALEYNNHPDYAAQAVLVSTLCSSLTVTVVVYLSAVIF